MDTKKEGKNLLKNFTKEIEALPGLLIEALIKNAGDEDEKHIINSLSETLKSQFAELSNSISDLTRKSTKQESVEIEQLLKSSAALDVTKSFKLALPSIGSLFGKLGLQEIIFAIKKIIRALFKKLPKWLDTVLNIIDEIINLLLGGSSSKTKNILSMAEQNFLKEITLVDKLNQINFGQDQEDDDN